MKCCSFLLSTDVYKHLQNQRLCIKSRWPIGRLDVVATAMRIFMGFGRKKSQIKIQCLYAIKIFVFVAQEGKTQYVTGKELSSYEKSKLLCNNILIQPLFFSNINSFVNAGTCSITYPGHDEKRQPACVIITQNIH